MDTKPQQIKGKEEATAYLELLNTQLSDGLLIMLPTDNFHQEREDYSINRRYLDVRTNGIFQLKGSVGGPFDRFHLERVQMRTKTISGNNLTTIESSYNLRYFKPPLFAGASTLMKLAPPIEDSQLSAITIDLSNCNYRVANTLNNQVIDALTINSIVRSLSIRQSLFSTAIVNLTEIRIHSIDTGFDVVDYVIRRCLDQAFDDGTNEPTVTLKNGLNINKISMRHSGSLQVKIIGREG